MRFYNIEKSGIKNVIDEAQFEKIYKPKGWKIVGDAETGELIAASDVHAETKIRNKARMQKVKPQKFDDGLFKEEKEDGEI